MSQAMFASLLIPETLKEPMDNTKVFSSIGIIIFCKREDYINQKILLCCHHGMLVGIGTFALLTIKG